MNKNRIIFLSLAMFFFAQAFFGQSDSKMDFKIYLLADDIKPAQLATLDIKKSKPVGEPVLSQRDIMNYLKDRHEIRFDYTGADRLRKIEVPTSGKSFIAFVGDEPVYTGAFFKQYSSQNFNGFAIDITNLAGDFPVVKIAAKYPETHPKIRTEDERQDDARSDKRIMNALERAGVLFEELKLSGKCLKIEPTWRRNISYIFTFKITEDYKENFGASEITFSAANQLMNRLLKAIETKGLNYSKEGWKFDGDKEIFLKFERQITPINPAIVLKDLAELK